MISPKGRDYVRRLVTERLRWLQTRPTENWRYVEIECLKEALQQLTDIDTGVVKLSIIETQREE